MTRILLLVLYLSTALALSAQQTRPSNGAAVVDHSLYVLRGATVHVSPSDTRTGAHVWVQDGLIVKVAEGEPVPAHAISVDCKGKHLYASFIDLHSNYGMPKPEKKNKRGPQIDRPEETTAGWNQSILPERNAVDLFSHNSALAEKLRSQGFGTVLTHVQDGIIRGTAAAVTLGDQTERKSVIKAKAAQVLALDKGTATQDYPSSRMGAMALIRQSLYDAIWYTHSSEQKEYNASLEALSANLALPQIMVTREKNDILRTDPIADELGIQFMFIGTGNEYERVNDIRTAGGMVIIPLDFPKAYDVSDPIASKHISLHDLRHWEQAPANAAYLSGAGVVLGFTMDGLSEKGTFLAALRQSVQQGLLKETALAALTTEPAKAIGLSDKIGSLQPSSFANFIVTDGDLFDSKTRILSHWVQGQEHVIEPDDHTALSGVYDLNVDGMRYTLIVKSNKGKEVGKLIDKKDTLSVTITEYSREMNLSFALKNEGHYRLHGSANQRLNLWSGNGETPKGKTISWNAIRRGNSKQDSDSTKNSAIHKVSRLSYPNLGHGWTDAPMAKHIVIRNATVWTNTAAGIMEDADVAISEGKILAVGHNLDLASLYKREKDKPAFESIEAYGKHVTCGIIDEHSHIGITGGVNESGQASTAEVTIEDVVDPEDIDIYYALSGGVTACQLLHGSANPIGGRSALVKLHWGQNAERMKIQNSPKFIKFALGENVKQSNWGDAFQKRFPQTRMGVEQVFYDHFNRAREYQPSLTLMPTDMGLLLQGDRKVEKKPFARRDLELESLSEILAGNRFITCHSYQQSEINMLMHVGDSMGFTVNTFTHILEGYKVADKMKAHGAGASTFSDWWSYKYEVREATPYNAALMHQMGLTVAINSDDAEMGRRLNQEAAKGIKYGGMSAEDAWKMVTLNPAKLLHLDDRMGSLEAGKDADIVIWSGDPLSAYSKAEQTYVDGICYFDRSTQAAQRSIIDKERAALIQKMLADKGSNKRKPSSPKKHRYHCDHIGE